MTAETIGKQLAQARAVKGLTLDEAAHLTKVRPDKLAALEQDDLSAFPNNTYARGFLLIYGRFLGVDVRSLASQLESGNPISIEDYQYLNAELDAVPDQRTRMRPREATSRRPSIAPLIVFVVLIVVAAFVVNFFIKAQQLSPLDPASRARAEAEPAVEKTNVEPAKPDAPAATPAPQATAQSDREFVKPAPAPAAPTVPPSLPAPTPRLSPPGLAPLAAINELSIDPVKKTRVRIRRNDFAGAPVFEDFLYPGVGPLKMKGAKFYIEVLDAGTVSIRVNGQPRAYQAPGLVIQ